MILYIQAEFSILQVLWAWNGAYLFSFPFEKLSIKKKPFQRFQPQSTSFLKKYFLFKKN